ncbi:hypothetical protein DFP89_11443 [Paracoccus lutimaris]|uniref:Uncharacterized protein n=1 Tax=Paracoccus lutimaris TaxID=1490030 RepID=A0A368YQ48_9RHOB|nr:hypothetical protein DFP89_11443 [Paracoccus lutimaris]
MIKLVLIFLLVIVALALAAGPGVRRVIARILGLPHK